MNEGHLFKRRQQSVSLSLGSSFDGGSTADSVFWSTCTSDFDDEANVAVNPQ